MTTTTNPSAEAEDFTTGEGLRALLHRLHPDASPSHPATGRHRRTAELIAHRNLVLTRLDPDEAARTLALMAEAGLDVGGAGACP